MRHFSEKCLFKWFENITNDSECFCHMTIKQDCMHCTYRDLQSETVGRLCRVLKEPVIKDTCRMQMTSAS